MERSTRRTLLAAAFLLGCAATMLGCAANPLGDPELDAGGDPLADGGTVDAHTAPDASRDAAADTDAEAPPARALSLALEIPDGACPDLALADRGAPAVRFVVGGPPETVVELWADKPSCSAEPFLYQSIALDAEGTGAFELAHAGSDGCHDNLLGTWRVWLVQGAAQTPRQDLTFASGACADAASCGAATGYCPEPAPPADPSIPKDQVFVLSAAERARFTPPDPSWVTWGSRYEDYPLREMYEAFDEGRAPVPMNEEGGDAGWLEPTGGGSRNHGPMWMGESALGHAFQENAARFDVAAANCITILELDDLQGHMRDEAIGGYAGFWEGGVAAMALAAHYAPTGSTMGPALLAKARQWWMDHVAVLRRLSFEDGQVALLGARTGGAAGETDSWSSLSAAVNLQLIDPRPHDRLHPTIASLLTPTLEPAAGSSGVPVRWYRPRHVAERWVVLRAVQSGAILAPPVSHPAPDVAQRIFRWSVGSRVHLATPEVRGLRPARWAVSWAAGSVVRVEVGETHDMVPASSGRGPHPSPEPLGIPAGASPILGGP